MAEPRPWVFLDHRPEGTILCKVVMSRGRLTVSRGDSISTTLNPQGSNLLEYLLRNAGKRLTKEQLRNVVWPDDSSTGQLGVLLAYLKNTFDDHKGRLLKSIGTPVCYQFLDGPEDFLEKPEQDPVRLTPLRPFASVPLLPEHFIERPNISGPLIEKLLSTSGSVAITAIDGMGGVGKTIMAINACNDQAVRNRFPDGILWLKIGREPLDNLEVRFKKISGWLNQEFREYSETSYRTLFTDKAILIVLDDVWHQEDVEPFRLPPGSSRLLYTTRDKSLSGPLGAVSEEVGFLDDPMARRFLGRWAEYEGNLPEPHASGIIKECGGLALGLSMIGAALKGRPVERWADRLSDLKAAQLKNIRARPAGYEYDTLHAAIAVSVDALDSEDQSLHLKSRYLRLATLPEGMPAATPILQALWGGDDRSARDIAEFLIDRCLVQRDAEGILLHDLQHKYIRGEHPHPEALRLQHSALLRSYHVIRSYPEQFFFQMTGRLLASADQPGITSFLEELRAHAPRPRLRPLRAALDSANGPAQRRLKGHKGPVRAVALTPDGNRAVSGSDDNTLIVWDLKGSEESRVLQGHSDKVNAVAITPDGKRAVSGSWDGTLMVWDLDGPEQPRILRGHEGGVMTVAITADGKRAVSGSSDRTLMVWDLERFEPTRTLAEHTGWVSAVAMTPDGSRAISGSEDTTLIIWDLNGDQLPRTLKGHAGWVDAVAVTPDGSRAVSRSMKGDLRIWDLEGDQQPRVLQGEPDGGLALTADGKTIVSIGFAGLQIWNLAGYERPRLLAAHCHGATAIALTADGKRAVSGSEDHTLIVWNLDDDQPHVQNAHSRIDAVAVTPDGGRVVSGSSDGTLTLWALGDDRSARALEGHSSRINVIAVTADGKTAVSGSEDHELILWDLNDCQILRRLKRDKGWVTAVALASDGKRAIAGCSDGTLIVLDMESDKSPLMLEGYTDRIEALSLSADGNHAVTISISEVIEWDLEGTPVPERRRQHQMGGIHVAALSSDGKRAVAALPHGDNRLIVWDLESQRPVRRLEGHKNWIRAVAVMADGKRAVSGSEDGTLILWDLNRGESQITFTADAILTACAVAGQHVAAGDIGGHLHLLVLEE